MGKPNTRSNNARGFDKSLLPAPDRFYRNEFRITGRPSRGWVTVRCCFAGHSDKHPSLRLNLHEGHFICNGCGAKGHDIISFVMLRDGIDFKQACRKLGCWRNEPATALELRELAIQKRERQRLDLAARQLEAEEKELRLEARANLHMFSRIYRETSDRLTSLGISNTSTQAEACWSILSMTLPEIRTESSTYHLLAFGTVDHRARFVLNTNSRDNLIRSVIDAGYVRDDEGKRMEVFSS